MEGTMSNQKHRLSYRASGVDIDAGDALVGRLKEIARGTSRQEVLAGIGGFGALIRIPKKYKYPLLVSGADGVGTKLRLGIEAGSVSGLGQDLVAMCVNDVLVSGAEPLFFLDYFASGQLEPDVAEAVVSGVATGCKAAGCALVGGETAEMPGLYAEGDFDLAGFCVAVVERSRLINGRKVRPGDVLIGLPSTGPHSNGYSLIRTILARSRVSLEMTFEKATLGEALLAPTRIYVKPVLNILSRGIRVHAMAHITGGGITGNLVRMFPDNCGAVVDTASWTRPAIFEWLKREGCIHEDEMRRVFNCGVGFVLVVPPADADITLSFLKRSRLRPWVMGNVTRDETHSVGYL